MLDTAFVTVEQVPPAPPPLPQRNPEFVYMRRR